MAELVGNCPRCHADRVTFDLLQDVVVSQSHGWQYSWEAFCVCRHCERSTVFVVMQKDYEARHFLKQQGLKLHSITGSISDIIRVVRHISQRDEIAARPPEHLPNDIEDMFNEGAACLAISCNNAAGTMFRLCLDRATVGLLPEDGTDGLNKRIRRSLGLRLEWLLDTGRLSESLRDLSTCIKEDGNDGAHEGTLSEDDAKDILDFTQLLLERLYTEPKRIELAAERRQQRRAASQE